MLSKTDYILGMDCEVALWLTKKHSELVPDIDVVLQRRFDIGIEAQELARNLFPSGKMVGEGDISYVALKTKQMSEQYNILFEATAVIPDKAFCRIDIMEREGDTWNLIEIKSATEVKNNYIDDLAFQKYVFEQAGYKINRCKVVYLNNHYVRNGDLNIYELFVIEDVSLLVQEVYVDVANNIDAIIAILQQKNMPEVLRRKTDPCKTCAFKSYCRKDLPEYPAYYLFHTDKSWQKFYNEYLTYNVEEIPEDYKLGSRALIDRDAYLSQQIHAEPKKIREWLDQLEYPLYYLDYESAQLAIPLFDNSNPYNQIAFQFSLHIQEKPNGELQHISFLHKERSDPRRFLAECLVNNLGTKGSVIVYNKTFEASIINKKLIKIFPDLAEEIAAINDRIIDQEDVFSKRYLYSPKQKSSASIKYVLPAFCDLSYQGMKIANGGEAMSQYEAFLKGKQTPEETANMFAALEKYCAQDTYAMVKLMEVLFQYAEK